MQSGTHLIITQHETSCHCWSKPKNKRRHFSSFAPERKSGRWIWGKTSANIREVMQTVSEWGHRSNLDRDTSPLSPLQTLWYGGSKCSLNKETGKRRKWHGFYFQTKIPHRPPTHCLTLFLSLSPSPHSPLCLVAFSAKCRCEVSVHPMAPLGGVLNWVNWASQLVNWTKLSWKTKGGEG